VRDAIGRLTRNVRLLRESAAFDRRKPRRDPLLPRGAERAFVRAFGRTLTCSECGRPLFRTVPIVWRGRVWLVGAYDNLVRVSFDSSETMEFRHARLDECPSPERPWVE
jgi:hypothetical protein